MDETKNEEERKKNIFMKIVENLHRQVYSPNTIFFEENSDKTMASILLQWCHANKFCIIYNSENQELSTKQVWRTLQGRINIITVICTTNGSVFGSYHSVIPKRQSSILCDDKKHFMFTLKNPFNVPPTRFKQNLKNENQLIIHRDIQNSWIFGVGYGFHIRGEDKSYIGSASGEQLNRGYIDTVGLNSDIFNDSHYPSYFSFSRILFVQLY
ncbi:hypothetical protein EDI_041240 [Entamoeba dispar SAW760]|uniref:TLDc domain-containing protein n=1 Tax=Entamoeba dispar (strain ATCC PRA-260 / SAW760) TaxID=370354 RepID=B0ETP5_ENTDS|nr:uncharacterized protein EDI_041240 [Entamoeba dispar SAW760]EDR22095.1 hypothetical protein EDI_041240 [Entamoeba dispar SAW760]|eukprot:EDR22095.1 hypothetical protein EDI_041240 [Entamoeba dispar SAW760]